MKKIILITIIASILSCTKEDKKQETTYPVACFEYNPTKVLINTLVVFGNCSDFAESYTWSFGDGSSSNIAEPEHAYFTEGTYTISLIAVNTFGSDTITKSVFVDNPCNLNMENFDYSFGIEYDNHEKYLVPGEQSDLNDTYLEEIRSVIGTPEQNIAGIKTVCHWFNQNFTFTNAGGSIIGKKTVDELYESKTFYGCHSAALVISSVLREFGFPAVMIETASIVWANKCNNGTDQGFVGHVMTEVYVSDKWILLDNNCTYVENYDWMNPFISTMDQDYFYYKQGLLTYAKGVDIWDYGVRDESDTHEKMINFANNIDCFKDLFNSVNYIWKN